MSRIAVASDHAGIELKAALVASLRDWQHEVDDLGAVSDMSVDYPDFGYRLAHAVASGAADRGIAICGTGIGISIAVNRHPGVRCALVSDPYAAALAREHNDANVLALGARMIGQDMAKACVMSFLVGTFAGGRHDGRVAKLASPHFEDS